MRELEGLEMGVEEKILVVGCGGIGCELLKLLARESVQSITLVDHDAIEMSNLSRQFFFCREDIGKSKVMVAAERFREMRGECDVFPICANILEFDARFFAEYTTVFNCLDNVEARSHVNRRCFISKTPLVDGGSGGFKGQAYYFDYFSECFDCIPKKTSREHAVCTIRSRPTKFEHCIVWAREVFFDMKLRVSAENEDGFYETYLRGIVENCSDMSMPDELSRLRKSPEYAEKTVGIVEALKSKPACFDRDSGEAMELVYNVAWVRGSCAGIEPLSFDETVTVAGNIVPIVSTTNAVVASLMVLSLRNKCNYYSVGGGRVVSRLGLCERSTGCSTCSHDWYGMLYKEWLTFGDLDKCFRRSEMELLAYSDDDNLFTSEMRNRMGERIALRYDAVGEAICMQQGRRRRVNLYFMRHGEELYFGRMYKASLYRAA